MEKRGAYRDKYKNVEKKGQTKITQSHMQINHPKVIVKKHTKDKIQTNLNNQPEKYNEIKSRTQIGDNKNKNLEQNHPKQINIHINQEKIDNLQKKEYKPYSCIPKLEKNDTSFSLNPIPE